MHEWVTQALQSPTFSLAAFVAAFILGLIGSVSSCCNLAVFGAIAGYSGSLGESLRRRDIMLGGLFFMLGTVIALGVLGAVAGFVSQTVGSTLGSYWKLFAGLVMVVFGLATLGIIPFKLPRFGPQTDTSNMPHSTAKWMVYGLAVGGGTTACSVGCNPVLPAALAVATLQGHTILGAAILGAFAIGYSLPLAGALIGLGLGVGKLTSVMQKSASIVKMVAGVLLIGVGFYLLATV